MSGGLQQLLKDYCGREIPYIHCLNHRRLVEKDTLSDLIELSEFFQLVQDLYNFFKIPKIDELYEGLTLKRLITTRWDGHFSSLKVISKSMEGIRTTLKTCRTSRSVDSEHRSKAKGYLASLEEPVNIFLMNFLMDVLLNLLNLMFQKQDSSLRTALSTLRSVRKDLDKLAEKYTVEHITSIVNPKETTQNVGSPPLANRKKNDPCCISGLCCNGKASMLSR